MSNVLALQLLPTEQSPIGGECTSYVSCPSSQSSGRIAENAE